MTTFIILASGPSMTRDDADTAVRAQNRLGASVIAVNSTFRLAPGAARLYAGDFMWWKTHMAEVRRTFTGQLWTCDRATHDRFPLVNHIKGANREGLGSDVLHMNGNSGAAALNLAVIKGARRILLLGFDMKPGPAGEKHWHPDHPAPLTQAQCFDEWVHRFDRIAADAAARGVRVVNCSRETALRCFPRMELGEAL